MPHVNLRMQTVPPCIRVVKTSPIETSKVQAANWKTLECGPSPNSAPYARALVQMALCSRTIPLGTPVEPLVKQMKALLSGRTKVGWVTPTAPSLCWSTWSSTQTIFSIAISSKRLLYSGEQIQTAACTFSTRTYCLLDVGIFGSTKTHAPSVS